MNVLPSNYIVPSQSEIQHDLQRSINQITSNADVSQSISNLSTLQSSSVNTQPRRNSTQLTSNITQTTANVDKRASNDESIISLLLASYSIEQPFVFSTQLPYSTTTNTTTNTTTPTNATTRHTVEMVKLNNVRWREELQLLQHEQQLLQQLQQLLQSIEAVALVTNEQDSLEMADKLSSSAYSVLKQYFPADSTQNQISNSFGRQTRCVIIKDEVNRNIHADGRHDSHKHPECTRYLYHNLITHTSPTSLSPTHSSPSPSHIATTTSPSSPPHEHVYRKPRVRQVKRLDLWRTTLNVDTRNIDTTLPWNAHHIQRPQGVSQHSSPELKPIQHTTQHPTQTRLTASTLGSSTAQTNSDDWDDWADLDKPVFSKPVIKTTISSSTQMTNLTTSLPTTTKPTVIDDNDDWGDWGAELDVNVSTTVTESTKPPITTGEQEANTKTNITNIPNQLLPKPIANIQHAPVLSSFSIDLPQKPILNSTRQTSNLKTPQLSSLPIQPKLNIQLPLIPTMPVLSKPNK